MHSTKLYFLTRSCGGRSLIEAVKAIESEGEQNNFGDNLTNTVLVLESEGLSDADILTALQVIKDDYSRTIYLAIESPSRRTKYLMSLIRDFKSD
jgi:hypothetical protein